MAATPQKHGGSPLGFLDLPHEIRVMIYDDVFLETRSLAPTLGNIRAHELDDLIRYKACNLANTCQQIGLEMMCRAGRFYIDRLAFEINIGEKAEFAEDHVNCTCGYSVRPRDINRCFPITAFISSLDEAEKEEFFSRPLTVCVQSVTTAAENYKKCLIWGILPKLVPQTRRIRVLGLNFDSVQSIVFY